MMAALREVYPSIHQPNETILVLGGGDDVSYTTWRFHQFGRMREEIIADHDPELAMTIPFTLSRDSRNLRDATKR